MSKEIILNTDLPDLKLFKKGKVRDIYDLGDNLLLVATDRISAFDSVLPSGIPKKGQILTALSEFWFGFTKEIIGNHLISTNIKSFPADVRKYADILEGRSMLAKKAKIIEIECVVRGYLSGSAWKEYKEKGSVCGISLSAGLKESEKLPQPIFTPATKAQTGHDINISEAEMEKMVGKEITKTLKEKSLQIYISASKYAESKEIIIADTKFEFGTFKDEIILVDEILTPDSSRFWPMEEYAEGRAQRSFDKQYVRDYLEHIKWDKNPPAPELPQDIVRKTSYKYFEAYSKITGKGSF